MNTHKVLLKLGFKICGPHKLESNFNYKQIIVPDLTVKKRVNAKYIEVKKIHLKNKKFYNQIYNKNLTIWVITINSIITNIWLDENKSDINIVYDIRRQKNYLIKSKSDIINLLPKDIKRNLIIDILFK